MPPSRGPSYRAADMNEHASLAAETVASDAGVSGLAALVPEVPDSAAEKPQKRMKKIKFLEKEPDAAPG